MAQRHHAVHPPTAVKPNLDINHKPEAYTPPERTAIAPEPNPSLIAPPPGLDATNARLGKVEISAVPHVVKAITRENDDSGDDDSTDDALPVPVFS